MGRNRSVKKLVILSMLGAIAYVLMVFIRIPVVLFLKYEPKDVVIAIGGFLYGPLSSAAVSLLVSLLEMITVSDTGPIGCLMNFISTCSFACTAAYLYKKKHTLSGAVLGLLAGSAVMTGLMLLWNWLVTPLYMGIPRAAVEPMLLPAFLPFNALKAGLNTAFTLLLYKPLVTALRRSGLLTGSLRQHTPTKGSRLGIFLCAAALLITCILILLAWRGIL